MSNQKQVTELIKKISGQANILTIPRVYLDITGDHLSALFLSQCVYWSDRGRGGWFYKSEKEWNDELGLSSFQVKRIRGQLSHFIETDLRKANGAPTMHYRVKMDELYSSIVKFLNNPLSNNSTMESEETQQSDCEETQQSLTETTIDLNQKITAEEGYRPLDNSVAIKITAAASGMSFIPPTESARTEQLTRMVEDYGYDKCLEALKYSCNGWKNTKGKNGRLYRITNMGWVDWAQDILISDKKTDEPQKKVEYREIFKDGMRFLEPMGVES